MNPYPTPAHRAAHVVALHLGGLLDSAVAAERGANIGGALLGCETYLEALQMVVRALAYTPVSGGTLSPFLATVTAATVLEDLVEEGLFPLPLTWEEKD